MNEIDIEMFMLFLFHAFADVGKIMKSNVCEQRIRTVYLWRMKIYDILKCFEHLIMIDVSYSIWLF